MVESIKFFSPRLDFKAEGQPMLLYLMRLILYLRSVKDAVTAVFIDVAKVLHIAW